MNRSGNMCWNTWRLHTPNLSRGLKRVSARHVVAVKVNLKVLLQVRHFLHLHATGYAPSIRVSTEVDGSIVEVGEDASEVAIHGSDCLFDFYSLELFRILRSAASSSCLLSQSKPSSLSRWINKA